MKYLVLNITYNHKLYNYFDIIKNKIAFKDGIDVYNLYNDNNLNFILQPNDFFYKNVNSFVESNEFDAANYCVFNMHEMFLKFYTFLKDNIDLINNYDYIVRCNSSTFINFRRLHEIVETLPRANCYAGYKLNDILVSGTCCVFSKDVILKLIDTELDCIQYKDNYDDVAIGNLISNTHSIPPTNIEWYNFSSGITPTEQEIQTSLNYPIIRIRNNNSREEIDVDIWKRLFNLYQECYFSQQKL